MGALGKAHSAPSDEMALRSPSLAGSYEGNSLGETSSGKRDYRTDCQSLNPLNTRGFGSKPRTTRKPGGQEAAGTQAVERGASGNHD